MRFRIEYRDAEGNVCKAWGDHHTPQHPAEKMNLNPGPLGSGDRDPVKMVADPEHRAPKCLNCGNVKAFCECPEFKPPITPIPST